MTIRWKLYDLKKSRLEKYTSRENKGASKTQSFSTWMSSRNRIEYRYDILILEKKLTHDLFKVYFIKKWYFKHRVNSSILWNQNLTSQTKETINKSTIIVYLASILVAYQIARFKNEFAPRV